MLVKDRQAPLANLTFFLRIDFNILNVYGFNDKHDLYERSEDLQPHIILGRVPLVMGLSVYYPERIE